jgi:hypothetical protein
MGESKTEGVQSMRYERAYLRRRRVVGDRGPPARCCCPTQWRQLLRHLPLRPDDTRAILTFEAEPFRFRGFRAGDAVWRADRAYN